MPCQRVCEEGRSKINNSLTTPVLLRDSSMPDCAGTAMSALLPAEVGATLIPQHGDQPGGETKSMGGEVK